MGRLDGQVAIVTGGGSGIGAATARCFAQEGAAIVVTGRTATKLDATKAAIEAAGGECEPVPGDVGSVESCAAAVDTAVARWGAVDILVNNAAIDHEAEFFEIDEAAWERVLRVNLTAPFLLSQLAGRVMRERGGGSIIHIASIGAHFNDGPFFPYDTSKAGLLRADRRRGDDRRRVRAADPARLRRGTAEALRRRRGRVAVRPRRSGPSPEPRGRRADRAGPAPRR